jgi:hypothetical protein
LRSTDFLDDVDKLFHLVSLSTGELHQFPRARDDCTSLRGTRDGDAPAAAKLEETFIAKDP